MHQDEIMCPSPADSPITETNRGEVLEAGFRPDVAGQAYPALQDGAGPSAGAMDYWMKLYEGHDPTRREMLCDLPDRGTKGPIDCVDEALGAELQDALAAFSARVQVGTDAIVVAAVAALIARIAGMESAVVGCRSEGGQPVPVRIDVAPLVPFETFLLHVRKAIDAAASHPVVRGESSRARNSAPAEARRPIFDAIVAIADSARFSAQGIAATSADLEFVLVREGTESSMRLWYDGARLSRAGARSLHEQARLLLRQCCDDPAGRLADYSLVTTAQRALLPDPQAPFEGRLIPDVFDSVAKWRVATPAATALATEKRNWSFVELLQEAEAIAKQLPGGVKRTVALYGERTPSFIFALLGILRSRHILMPLDPTMPDERIRSMIEQAGASILIRVCRDPRQGRFLEELAWETIFDLVDDRLQSSNGSRPPPESDERSDDAAYVFFTSGSTGRPKGILGSRKGLSHFLDWQRNAFSIGPGDRCAQLTAVGFDVLLRDVLMPLSSGATLCLPPPALLEGQSLDILSWLARAGITATHAVPAVFELWLASASRVSGLSRLRVLFFAGEPLTPALVRRVRALDGFNGKIVNLYGPTETTLAKAAFVVESESSLQRIPVGRPLPESQLLVLNSAGRLCGVGEQGEVVIRTAFPSLGYLDGQRGGFRANPFTAAETAYFTGDCGRYREDGCLELLGRKDFQVKIRGVRIELDEISAVLKQHRGVASAVSVARDFSGEKRVITFVTAERGFELIESELLQHCRERLWGPSVPARVIGLSRMPLLPNGKVDRRALPEIETVAGQPTAYLAPRGEGEARLAETFAAALGCERVGLDDHFFDLGGDSIRAIRVVSRLAKLRIGLKVADLFRYPTIRKLSEAGVLCWEVDEEAGKAALRRKRIVALDQVLIERADQQLRAAGHEIQGVRELSPTQFRLLVQCRETPDRGIYVVQKVIDLNGRIEPEICRQAFEFVVARHDGLRTRFFCEELSAVQVFLRRDELDFCCEDHSESGSNAAVAFVEEHLRKDRLRSFALEREPLFRVRLFRWGADAWSMVITYHHIAMDGWSFEVCLGDFLRCYEALLHDGKLPAPPAWQSGDFLDALAARDYDESRTYWRTYFAGAGRTARLPFVSERNESGVADMAWHDASEAHGLARLLVDTAKRLRVTANSVLQGIWALFLARANGTDEVVFGNVTSGRSVFPEAAEDVLGLLITIVPLRIKIDETMPFRDFVALLQEDFRRGDAHSYLPLSAEPGLTSIGSPLLDHVVVFQNYPADRDAATGDRLGFVIGNTELFDQNGYAFSLFAFQRPAGISVRFRHDRRRFSSEACRTVGNILGELIGSVAQHLDAPIGRILATPRRSGALQAIEGTGSGKSNVSAAVSAHQERILFIDRFETGTLYDGAPTYHNVLKILDVQGDVSVKRLASAAKALVARHAILRTSFPCREHGFAAAVAAADQAEEPNVQEFRCGNRNEAVARAIENAARPFQVQQGPLVRFEIVHYEPGRSLINLGAHHVIADQSTMDGLVREWMEIYHGVERPPVKAPEFAQFGERQRQAFADERSESRFYWSSKLRSETLPVLDFPTDRTRDAVHVYASARHGFVLDASTDERAAQLAREAGCEMQDVFLTAFICLAYRRAKQRTGIVGTSLPNRADAGTRNLLGPVANLLPIVTELPEDFSFRRALARVARARREATLFGDVPFERIVDLAKPAKDMSRTALFDLLFRFEEANQWKATPDGWHVQEIETNTGWGKYDLHLLLRHREGTVDGSLTYNRRYFEPASIDRLVDAYAATLRAALDRPEAPLAGIVACGEAERKLLASWEYSGGAPLSRQAASLAECFETTCDRFPRRVALTSFGPAGTVEGLTYAELDRRANQLARALQQRFSIGPGDLVGLFLREAANVLVGMLAVLKAGAAYVPLDPDSPPLRLQRICADCELPCIVTTASLSENVHRLAPLINLDGPEVAAAESHRLRLSAAPHDLAYVIYTSGSTGMPKGVLIEHRTVLSLFSACAAEYRLKEDDVWTLFHSCAFDFSVWEIWGAFLHGGRVVAVPHLTRRDPARFKKLLVEEKVTVLSQTPAALCQLFEAATDEELAALKASLRYIVCGGDRLDFSNLGRWFGIASGRARIVNMYGITETTVHSTYHVVEPAGHLPDLGRSIVGKPLAGVGLRILGSRGEAEPAGVTGEIHIGGAQLARGYLNRPELTHERFQISPGRDDERWYRSGDLGRWTSEGVVEYKGRNDAQVQLRGFRIEIGEIENALQGCTGVRQCVVKILPGDNGPELVGYCAFDGSRPGLTQLRSELLRSLPEYMVPSRFVVLGEMPLTINGKFDRNALPLPDADNLIVDADHSGTGCDTLEAAVLAAFRQVLRNEKVGATTDFFASGGHSLMAISLVGEIEKASGVRLDLAAVFELRTARSIASRVRSLEKTSAETMPLAEERKYYPLSSFQKQVYIEHSLNPEACQFNMPFALVIEGRLEADRFRAAVEFLVKRREILRTRFIVKQGRPFQQVMAAAAPDFHFRRDRDLRLPGGLEGLVKPFDLERPPLVRAVLIETAEDRHVLFVDVHHIAFDMFSFPLLVDDLIAGYRGATVEEGRRREYRDFATWEVERLETAATEELFRYWIGKLSDAPPSPQLPGILARTDRQGGGSGNVDITVDGKGFAETRAYIQRQKTTPYIFFLAAFKVALALRTNAHDVVVGSDDANRDTLETRDIMGFFINQIVLRSRINLHLSFEEQLARVAGEVAASLRHKSLPFYRIVERLNPERRSGRNPIFQVKFDFLPNWKMAPDIPWRVSPVKMPVTSSKNDLHLFVTETDAGFACSLHFDGAVYDHRTVADFMRLYKELLSEIIIKPATSMKELNVLNGEGQMQGAARPAESGGLRGFRRQKKSVQAETLFDERLPDARGLPLIMKAASADIELETWVPAHRDELFDKLRRYGALLFRNCRVNSIERFERIVKAICPEMIREYGDLPSVSEGARVYASTPYPPDKKILFHNESSHLPSWPRHQFFACLKPAERGGETPLVDCREVYRRLDPGVRDLFERKGLMYVRTFVRGFDVSWQDFFKTSAEEDVRAFCARNRMECEWIDGIGLQTRSRSPAVLKHPVTGEMSFFNQIQLHHPAFLEDEVRGGMQSVLKPEHFPRNVLFGDGTPIDDALARATLQVYRDCEVALPWERGDLIVVDNLLVAHARNEYEGSRSIIVALADLMHAPAETVATK